MDYCPFNNLEQILEDHPHSIAPPTYYKSGLEKTRSSGLRFWQELVYTDDARMRTICAGRRLGKTKLAVEEAKRAAQTGLNKKVWYIAPTIRQAKEIFWDMLKESIPKENIERKDETYLTIKLKGYDSLISLKGVDNPDSLRGSSLDFVIVDEVQDIPLEVIDVVLRPAMADKKADGLFLGTPKGMGKNTMYLLHLRGKTLKGWKSWTFTTAQGGNVDREELAFSKEQMTLSEFRQEYEASFESVQGRIYYNFDINETVTEDVEDNGSTIIAGIDFNVNPMSCVVGVRHRDEWHIIDEIIINDSNTEQLAEELTRRYPDRTILAYPDASGRSGNTSARTGETDFTILKKYGIQVIAPRKNPPVKDRINCVNALLLNAEGRRRLFIHPRCKEVIRCMDGQLYKKGTRVPDKDSGLDHTNDALGYYIHAEFNLVKREVRVVTLDSVY